MSLVRLTSEGEVRLMPSWAEARRFRAVVIHVAPGAYDRIVEAMNRKIDRMDVVACEYVVCERATNGSRVRNRLASDERGQEAIRSIHRADLWD